ncbi:hypothetical protein J6590_014917 [Homalodisca vitripennis]|nr:hypothetical protein J6590_014917 [Homalodisca vitripennis]
MYQIAISSKGGGRGHKPFLKVNQLSGKNITDGTLRKNKRVCELHFRREDITVTGRLKEGSIPFPYDAPLVEPDTTTSSYLAIPQWSDHHQLNLPVSIITSNVVNTVV